MESKRVSGPLGSAFVYAAVFIDSKVLRVLTTDIAVTTWDVEKRELLSTVSLAGGLDRIEVGGVSPDGKLVAFGSRGTRDGECGENMEHGNRRNFSHTRSAGSGHPIFSKQYRIFGIFQRWGYWHT